MVLHTNQAWITSVLNDKDANKASVLAGSLRRVLTTKKIVVVFTPNVSEDSRDLLRDKFDLAVLIDQPIPDGVKGEDFAKIFALSFNIFNKCVYLSTSTMVLRNCDDIFDEHKSYAVLVDGENGADTSVFLFTPSTHHYKAMKKILGNEHFWKTSKLDKGNFSNYFGKWLVNQDPESVSLKTRYNQKIFLKNEIEIYDGLQSDLVIVNFADVHPIEVADKIISNSITSLGVVESFVADKWLTIYMEEVRTRSCLQSEEAFPTHQEENKRTGNEPIAVVGMSCRFPGGANSVEEFWKMLVEGKEGIHQLPHHRWTKESSIIHATSRKVDAGFLNTQIDEFDAKFFGVSPKEAVFMDPQQRLLHEVTWEALEDAAMDPLSLRGSHAGIFVGSWIHDYKDVVVRMADVDFFRMYMGNSIASGAARLSYFLGTTGPSIATESGCSSAMVAVDMALKSLRNRDTNLAIACGVNLLIHPFDSEMLSFVIAPDGRCKTFDSKANGFGRAEGCGVLLLKRLSDAVKDGDKIWGLIRGSAVTQEGLSKSLGTPTVQCEALSMELALKDAGVDPEEVTFVETHGTGTPVGDPMEVAAICHAYSSRSRTSPLIIGSVKTNIGHTESVSGIAGIMKVILSMKNDMIPKHLNFDELNPEINLEAIPAILPIEAIDWPKVPGKPRIAGVSSFGISGTDGHVIVQEAPEFGSGSNPQEISAKITCERPLHIMKISAKSSDALDELLRKYQAALQQALESDDSEEFSDFAHTANVGRGSFNFRSCLIAKNNQEALKLLQQNNIPRHEVQYSNSSKLCFLFTGQGSQYSGMAHDLYNNSPVFRMSFDRCERLLQKMYSISIKSILWPESGNNGEELSRTLYSQTSLFVVEYCLLKLWESWGVRPDFVLGHSLGEFAAAVAAGVLTLKGALTLVAERSRLIDALPRGQMIVIRADRAQVEKILKEFSSLHRSTLDYAALNSFDQTVLAGETKTVNLFAKFCEGKDIKTIILAATHAFHSRFMDPMLKEYWTVASKIKPGKWQDSSVEYISAVEGKLLQKEDLLKPDYWTKHTREKVNFIDACKVAQAEGCTYFLEIGPHPVLCALAMANIDGAGITCFPSLRRKQNEWSTILESVGKLFLSDWSGCFNWKGFDEFYIRKKVALPFYPFQRKKIWADVRPLPPKIHPLLGAPVKNASTVTIFENALTLKKATYLNDHVIGSSVVFPGAAFLEMLLAGGYGHVQCLTDEFIMPRRPITLKDLKIESPLGIDDAKSTLLQVVVDLLEEKKDDETVAVGYKSRVYHWHNPQDGQGHWVRHASCMYLPLVTDEGLLNMEEIDVESIKENWTESNVSSDLYKKLPEVGLRFGSTFQSLEKGWSKKEENVDNVDDCLLVEVKVPEGVSNYIAHPVLVDAMIQGALLWGSKDRIHKKLHVPVSIKEFTWLRGTDSPSRFIHCSKTVENGIRVTLLDGNGTSLMTMSGVEFVETTASVVESLIRQQSSQAPVFWDEVWKNRSGPLEDQVILENIEGQIFSDEVIEKAVEMNALEVEDHVVYTHLDGMTVMTFLNTLYDLGWAPNFGDRFTIQSLMSELGIVETYRNFTRFFCRNLVTENYLSQIDPDTFEVLPTIAPKADLVVALRHVATDSETSRADYKIINELGRKLSEVLRGKIPPLTIIFPEGSGTALADDFYETLHTVVSKSSNLLVSNIISRYASGVEASTVRGDGKVRVLEVGAGTGMHTGLFLQQIEDFGLPFEYYYTDISAAFFMKAEEKFSKWKKQIIYKKLNIEEDPLQQGYCPGYFDIIIAAEVIHSTKSIKETLSNLRLVLRDGGSIQIVETTRQDRRISFIFGLLDGYWRFQDFDLRPDHATLSPEKWEESLNSTGYELAVAIPCYNSVHSLIFAIASNNYYPNNLYRRDFLTTDPAKPTWLIYGDHSEFCKTIVERLESLDRDVKIVYMSDSLENQLNDKAQIEEFVGFGGTKNRKKDKKFEGVIYLWGLTDFGDDELNQDQVSKPYLTLCQYLWDIQKLGPKVFMLTRGIFSVDDTKNLNPGSGTLIGMSKVLRTETSLHVKCIDIPPNQPVDDQIDDVFHELWYHEDHEELVAYRAGKRYSPRLVTIKIPNENLSLPKGTDRFQLILPETRLISDLQFGFLNCFTLGEHEIEVKVKAAALNFRDVFVILKPDKQFENLNAVGADFAGVVTAIGTKVSKWKVGDAVFGCNIITEGDAAALPSHLKTKETAVVPVPDSFTFAEAATLPAVFCTAFYCLHSVANIKESDTVLIHTASGGVGLSAIQIAQHAGAKIIATAGSEKKRAYLRSLGIENVFHSRNTDFGDQILEVTGGRGVDIVLNSLTGPGFKEATLKACGKGARFIEMSKLNIWEPEEVQALRNDVEYTIVDLSAMKEEDSNELKAQMRNYVESGLVKPIPYVRFDGVNIRAALNYLQKAKHIGKIVCIMPEVKLENAKFTSITPLFNDRSTYIITGGVTGGIGLETAKYMLAQGAKHLVLVGRSKPHDKAQELLNFWKESGYNVIAWSVDVGDYSQCQELIRRIKDPQNGLPPLRGIMHAAGTLSDGTLPNQSWEKFEHTFNAKVKGSWNLHSLTLDCQMEHFVFFSSLAALFGTPGQANHSAGNYYEDCLARYRSSMGLPATTINWGPWGQVGVATDIEIPGMKPLSTAHGLLGLDMILRSSRVQTGVMIVDSFSLFAKFCPGIKNYIDDRSLFNEIKGPVFNLNSDEFWDEVDSVENREEKEEVFQKYIKLMVRTILKMEPDEPIDNNVEFQTLGVDSLMMLEMKNSLQNLFGSRMTVAASDLKGCNTTQLLASKLVEILLTSSAAGEIIPSMEELKSLMQEDSHLQKHIAASPTNLCVSSPSDIHSILMTGATGMLAPYLLKIVSNMPQISRIVCLVRKRGKLSGEERLVASLKNCGLYTDVILEKVECIEGDISQSHLGLTEDQYNTLAETLDCVIHCAAKVDHLQKYRKTQPQEKFHIRHVNVFGTKHILEFASTFKTKMVLHCSTFAMIYSIDKEKNSLSEEWESGNIDYIPYNSGYTISKYVAEQLVKQAVERGIPCKSFRLPFIAGDSQTGWHDIRGNHTMLRFLTYLKVGACPSMPLPIIQLPVDYCAEVTAHIFFNDSSPFETFNVVPRSPELEPEFTEIAKNFNYSIEIVEYGEFLTKIKALGETSPIHAFLELYENEELVQKMTTSPAIPSLEHWITEDIQKYFHSVKVEKYCPELYDRMESPLQAIQRDLQFLKKSGIFDKFGL